MTNPTPTHLRALLDRIARLSAADKWAHDLNPTQLAALDYLARANRFSRAPSQVADYLGATRGTVSQTLKSLVRKGLIDEHAVAGDKRRLTLTLSPKGKATLTRIRALDDVLAELPAKDAKALVGPLEKVLGALVQRRGGRAFGLCGQCRYHQRSNAGSHCALLNAPLAPPEADQICHEFAA